MAGRSKGTVGIIGLGIMGGAFARNLTKSRWRVVGYDIDDGRKKALAKAGVDPQDIFDLISIGAGNSRVFELRAPMMVKDRYDDATMKIKVWQKDMDVIGGFAKKMKVPTPLFSATVPV